MISNNQKLSSYRLNSRRGLAKVITLLESSRHQDRQDAEALIDQLLAHSRPATKIAISGPPGVGKSTFIEALGQELLKDKKQIAILAIDPTSPNSGGSILGDRTRMEKLSRHPNVFIRPSPSGLAIGGVARHTREVIIACENAGYDTIIVETVGVGQSEYIASSMVDAFIMLHQPNSGDDIQGIKRGILEIADIIAITKADGEFIPAAKLAKHQLSSAFTSRQNPEKENPKIILTSALNGTGIAAIKETLYAYIRNQQKSGALAKRRADQAKTWLYEEIRLQLFESFYQIHDLRTDLIKLENSVMTNSLSGTTAARTIVNKILSNKYIKDGA